MADYLSREEILRVFDNLTVKNPDDKYQHGMQDAIDCLIPEVINGMESADTVKHGRWIEVTPKHSRCSVCDTTCLISVYPISKGANFCPNCGADMRGDTE